MDGRLEYHGIRFSLDDLRGNMRAKYRNERPRFYYDMPDGTPLGYVMTLPDGGYIARLEDTQAWYAGPYDSESDAFENLFRLIARYHSVDDPHGASKARSTSGRKPQGSAKRRPRRREKASAGMRCRHATRYGRPWISRTCSNADTPTTRTSPSA